MPIWFQEPWSPTISTLTRDRYEWLAAQEQAAFGPGAPWESQGATAPIGVSNWPTAQPTEGATALPGAPLAGPAPVETLPYYALSYVRSAPQDVGYPHAQATPEGGISPMYNPMYSGSGQQQGPVIGRGIGTAIPIITKMALAAMSKHPVRSLIGGTSLIGTAWQLLGKSPKEYLEDQGLPEFHAMLGADFLEFLERAIQEGLLNFPEVPRGYEKESFYEGLNYLHINMRTGRIWLTDKVSVGRYKRYRD